jgi:hypothetical protein
MEALMGRPQLERRHGQPRRVLAVADWSIDPRAVADVLRAESDEEPSVFGLLVPSRLPALDWIGDPYASRPCAERQLDALGRLAEAQGLVIERAGVGDPERVAAIRTFLHGWSADRILLCDRGRIVSDHPLSVRRRLARSTDQAVQRVAVSSPPSARRRFVRRAARCAPARPQTS